MERYLRNPPCILHMPQDSLEPLKTKHHFDFDVIFLFTPCGADNTGIAKHCGKASKFRLAALGVLPAF